MESVTIALRVLLAITSDQKEKQRAIAAGIVDSCTLLLEEDDENVREQSAYALASLATVPASVGHSQRRRPSYLSHASTPTQQMAFERLLPLCVVESLVPRLDRPRLQIRLAV